MKLLFRFITGLSLLVILGCSHKKQNYVVANSFLIPKGESKLAKFNDLYPTNQIQEVNSKLASQESEQYLIPPTVG